MRRYLQKLPEHGSKWFLFIQSAIWTKHGKIVLVVPGNDLPIAGFHSRDQQPCFSTKTKGSVCIIIELNSRRIWSGHQHGRLFFVLGTNMAVVTSCENRELTYFMNIQSQPGPNFSDI